MTYRYPTEEEVKYAMEQGWTETDARRGFTIFDYDGTGLLEIEVIDDCFLHDRPYDEEAAKEAERIGYCKIIPINELPYPLKINEEWCDFYGWVDTPENRKALEDFVDNYLKEEENK